MFDISVLGMGLKNPRARTGVFRTIENLLEGYIARDDIQLMLHGEPAHMEACVEYLQMKGIWEKGEAADRARKLSFPGKLLRFVSANKSRPKPETFLPPLYSDKPAPVDVFHSPWLPVPPEYLADKKVTSFITVHDLIPILFPEFFTEGNIEQFKKNLECITPETWVICNSHSTRHDLLQYHPSLDPEKTVVTHWAASPIFHPVPDKEKINQLKRKHHLPDRDYILSLATIEPRKNIGTLLRVFKRLIDDKRLGDTNLVLVGTKGWKYQEIMNFLASSKELSSRVFFTGYIDDEDLSGIYSGATAFVYPSYYEGFGLPLLEAMQCGVPVISSNTSSMPEVVEDAGILLPPDDEEGIAASIMKLIEDPELRHELSQRSIQQSKKFSWEKCVEETIGIYRKAMDS